MRSDAGLYQRYSTTHAGLQSLETEHRVARRDILPHLPKDFADQPILDIGCGQGLLLSVLRQAGYQNVQGVDLSEEQVEIARRNGVSEVQLADYRDVLRTRQWAAIIACDFLEHLTRDEVSLLFREAHRSLRPGGRLIVRSPNPTSPFWGHYQYGDFTHLSVISPRSFTQLAQVADFGNVSIHSCAPIAHGAKSTARWLFFRAWLGIVRLGFLAETGETGVPLTQNFVGVAVR